MALTDYLTLGNSGLRVSPMCLGTMTFGNEWGVVGTNIEESLDVLGAYLDRYKTQVYMVNTGWSGGGYGVGKRMDLNLTRRIVTAVLQDELADVKYRQDARFHFDVPMSCPGVEPTLLDPKSTWPNQENYDPQADKLAGEFRATFEKKYLGRVDDSIAAQCPDR